MKVTIEDGLGNVCTVDNGGEVSLDSSILLMKQALLGMGYQFDPSKLLDLVEEE